MEKVYHAIVRGYVMDGDRLDYPLLEELDKIADKNATKEPRLQECVTHYKPLATVECSVAIGRYDTARFSLVELKPETGRKHQLRRHMSLAPQLLGIASMVIYGKIAVWLSIFLSHV